MPRIENPQLRPQQGNIQLIIHEPTDDSLTLYLEVPISHLGPLCQHPRKYLRYLGWCILGIEGHVAMDSPESVNNIGDIGDLENQGVLIMPVFNSQKVCIFYINPCLRVISNFHKDTSPPRPCNQHEHHLWAKHLCISTFHTVSEFFRPT